MLTLGSLGSCFWHKQKEESRLFGGSLVKSCFEVLSFLIVFLYTQLDKMTVPLRERTSSHQL